MTFVHVGFPDVDFFQQWVRNGLGRISAPLLGMMSGYIFMLRPSQSFVSALIKKGRSLGTPFVLFSGVYIIIMYFLTDRYEADLLSIFVGNHFLGIYRWPSNYPLHYLIDLFKVSVSVFIICKIFARWTNRYIFLVLTLMIGTLFLIVLGDPFLSPNRYSVLPRADLFAFFLLGIILFRAKNILEELYESFNFRFCLLVISLAVFVYIAGIHGWIWNINYDSTMNSFSQLAGSLIQLLSRLSGSIVLLVIISYLPITSAKTQEILTRFALILFGTHVIAMHLVEYYAKDYMNVMGFYESIFLIYAVFFLVAAFFFALGIQVRKVLNGYGMDRKFL